VRRCAARRSDDPARGRRATPAGRRHCGGGGDTAFSAQHPPHQGNVAVRAPARARGHGAGRRARCRCFAERATVRVLHARAWSYKIVPNRPLRGRRGQFGTLSQLFECGIFGRTAVKVAKSFQNDMLEGGSARCRGSESSKIGLVCNRPLTNTALVPRRPCTALPVGRRHLDHTPVPRPPPSPLLAVGRRALATACADHPARARQRPADGHGTPAAAPCRCPRPPADGGGALRRRPCAAERGAVTSPRVSTAGRVWVPPPTVPWPRPAGSVALACATPAAFDLFLFLFRLALRRHHPRRWRRCHGGRPIE